VTEPEELQGMMVLQLLPKINSRQQVKGLMAANLHLM
jgi:hypothetical protein